MRQEIQDLVDVLNANPQGCNQFGCKGGGGRSTRKEPVDRREQARLAKRAKAEKTLARQRQKSLGVDRRAAERNLRIVQKAGGLKRAIKAAGESR